MAEPLFNPKAKAGLLVDDHTASQSQHFRHRRRAWASSNTRLSHFHRVQVTPVGTPLPGRKPGFLMRKTETARVRKRGRETSNLSFYFHKVVQGSLSFLKVDFYLFTQQITMSTFQAPVEDTAQRMAKPCSSCIWPAEGAPALQGRRPPA